jgi:hypothetical protein
MVLDNPQTHVLDYAQSGSPMSLPELEYNANKQSITFRNGRNRFVAASLLGQNTTPVATPAGTADQLVNFVNKFELPMDTASRRARARQMGFSRGMLDNGTNDTLNSSKSGLTTVEGSVAPGVTLPVDRAVASGSAADGAATPRSGEPQATELWYRADRPAVIDLMGSESHAQVVETLRDAFERGHDAAILNYTTPGNEAGQKIVYVRDANQLRSPQAAFDRSKKLSPDLLAGLAAGAVAVPAADFMRQRQQ